MAEWTERMSEWMGEWTNEWVSGWMNDGGDNDGQNRFFCCFSSSQNNLMSIRILLSTNVPTLLCFSFTTDDLCWEEQCWFMFSTSIRSLQLNRFDLWRFKCSNLFLQIKFKNFFSGLLLLLAWSAYTIFIWCFYCCFCCYCCQHFAI